MYLENNLLRQRISELKLQVELATKKFELATKKPGTTDSVYMFIDNSNVFIQEKKAMARFELVQEHLVRIDYGRLVKLIQMGRNMSSAPFIAGSVPPSKDTI
jgi:hypothetical protein